MICNEIDIYNASIVAVTETWLFDEVSQYYSYLDYHHFYRNRQNGGGGGVALYFNKTWSVSEARLPVGPPASCNVLPVMDMKSGHCWVLVYRPPNTSAEDTRQLISALAAFMALHKMTTLLGDFNLSKIAWFPSDNFTQPITEDSLSLEFLESIWADWDMEQLVQLPSRNEKFLDLILTTQADNYHSVSMFPPVLSSDYTRY